MSNINYTGIAQIFPTSSKYFTETCFCDVFSLPEGSKSLGTILSTKSNVQVVSTKLIETPVDISNEGQNLLGYKLIVELSLLHKIIYLERPLAQYSCLKNPALSANLGNTLKSVFIILPCSICGVDTCKLIRKNAFTVTPYIENISMQEVDPQNIYSTMDVFIDVSFNV